MGRTGSAVAAGADLPANREFLASARFWEHAEATGLAFTYACLIALVGGLTVGSVMGANRFARQVGEPILTTLYSIPKITLYPVILLIFGLGISAKVAFGALHGFFPVALFTIGAIKNTSPVLYQDGTGHAASAFRGDPHRAVPGRHARDRHWPAHRLLDHAAGNVDRRAVRLGSRRRFISIERWRRIRWSISWR